MTRTQLLLIKVAEECAEVAQRACKAAQFGLEEMQEGQALTNAERLHGEFIDLLAVMTMLDEVASLPSLDSADCEFAIAAKIAKVEKYLAYSIELGMVRP